MFNHIMIPIDRHLPPETQKAADVAAQVARWQGAKITVASVTSRQHGEELQGDIAISEELKSFTDQLNQISGADVAVRNVHSVDVGAEMDSDLTRVADEIGADLIIVGTHAPRITDYIFSSHAGYLAKHASMSVFVVR